MELRLAIITVACLSSLVPPALGTGILTTAAAVKGATVLGAKGALLSKGVLAAKGLASVAAKGIALKGAALAAAKGALIKGAAAKGAAVLNTKAALLGALAPEPVPKPVLVTPVLVEKPKPIPTLVPVAAPVPPPVAGASALMDHLVGLWGVVRKSLDAKTGAVGDLLGALQEKVHDAARPTVVYKVIEKVPLGPRFYPVPVFEKVQE